MCASEFVGHRCYEVLGSEVHTGVVAHLLANRNLLHLYANLVSVGHMYDEGLIWQRADCIPPTDVKEVLYVFGFGYKICSLANSKRWDTDIVVALFVGDGGVTDWQRKRCRSFAETGIFGDDVRGEYSICFDVFVVFSLGLASVRRFCVVQRSQLLFVMSCKPFGPGRPLPGPWWKSICALQCPWSFATVRVCLLPRPRLQLND